VNKDIRYIGFKGYTSSFTASTDSWKNIYNRREKRKRVKETDLLK